MTLMVSNRNGQSYAAKVMHRQPPKPGASQEADSVSQVSWENVC